MLEPLLLPVVAAAGRLLQDAGQVQEEPGGAEAELAERDVSTVAKLREALAAWGHSMEHRDVYVYVYGLRGQNNYQASRCQCCVEIGP